MTDNYSTEFDENQMTADSYKRIGAQLKTARHEHGFRLSDVARELRISGDYLKLLESGEFDQLPAPTYVSGFLRSYGKFVGLDGAELASRFYALQDHASSKMDYKLPATAAPPQRSAPAVASLCVVLAVGVYGGWYWFSGPKTLDATVESELAAVELDSSRPGMMEKNATTEAFESNSTTTAGMQPDEGETGLAPSIDVAPDAPSAPDTTVQSVSPAAETVAETATATVSATVTATETQPDRSMADDTVQTGAVDTASVATEPAVAADTATAAVSERPADAPQTTEMASRGTSASANSGSVTSDRIVMSDDTLTAGRGAAVATMREPAQEITIRAIASSWVEVVRGDGTTVLKKLMRAGDIYIVDDSSGLYLSTGNAGGIEILSGENEIITIGSVGEIVRDLPLAKNRLRDRF